jgi:hypothetical protein
VNVLRDVWTDHLSSIRAAAADLFTVLNKTYYTYYTYYTTHISKIHKTQFHNSNAIPMKMSLNCKNAREFRNALKGGPLIILNINLAY